MTHPVFLSVTEENKAAAVAIAERFPVDVCYFYASTGKVGVEFPDEIARELEGCQYFVIFWSASFVEKEWTRRELAAAGKRLQSGSLSNSLIVRLDDTPLELLLKNPISGKKEDLLKPFRDRHRASELPFDAAKVSAIVGSVLGTLEPFITPVLPRAELEAALRREINIDVKTRRSLIFVSGLSGNGRRTLIRRVMGGEYAHLTEHVLSIDTVDGPEDLLLRLWRDVLGKTDDELLRLYGVIKDNESRTKSHVVTAINEIRLRKSYVVLVQTRITDHDVVLPHWLVSFLGDIAPSQYPVVFYVLDRRLPDQMRSKFPNAGTIHVPALDEEECRRLVHAMVQAIDPRPNRWSDANVSVVAVLSGGTPELVKAMVGIGAREPSLEFLAGQSEVVLTRFAERVRAFTDLAMDKAKQDVNNLRVLHLLGRLSIAHLEALKEILAGLCFDVGSALYQLRAIGLVEQLSDGVYRVPPLIRRILDVYTTSGELSREIGDLLGKFAREPVAVARDDYGSIYLVNRMAAKLEASAPLSNIEEVFLTSALLFKVGLNAYRSGDNQAALSLLRRAFERRVGVRDESSKIEIIRYFGLAAVREGTDADIEGAVRALNQEIRSPGQLAKAQAMALFLQGFQCRLDQRHEDAATYFRTAYEKLGDSFGAERQRGTILNEWVRAMLRSKAPNYELAVRMSREGCKTRLTPFSLDNLVRALLAQTLHQSPISQQQVDENRLEIDQKLRQLADMCVGTSLNFDRMRMIELEVENAVASKNEGDVLDLDLTEAIELAEKALREVGRQDSVLRLWQLRYATEVGRNHEALRQDVLNYLNLNPNASRRHRGQAARYLIFTTLSSGNGGETAARRYFQQFTELFPRNIRREIQKVLGGTTLTEDLTDPTL